MMVDKLLWALAAASATRSAQAWMGPIQQILGTQPSSVDQPNTALTDPLGLPLAIFHHAAQQSTPDPDPVHAPSDFHRSHPREFVQSTSDAGHAAAAAAAAAPPGCQVTFVDIVRVFFLFFQPPTAYHP